MDIGSEEFKGKPRWRATVTWCGAGKDIVSLPVDIHEVEDLQDVIEGGPDWTTTPTINIKLEYLL